MAVDISALLADFAALVGDYRATQAKAAASEANFRCEDCEGCSGCRFCNGCRDCAECTYCEACVGCEKCTRCRGCEGCVDGNQLEHCRGCERSEQLVLCLDCSESSHCIACVGLVGEQHCILNRRYDRKDFFRLAKALKTHLEDSGSAALFAAPAADAPAGGFSVDALQRRILGRVDGPTDAPLPQPDDDGAETDDAGPWIEAALGAVARVEAPAQVRPLVYGILSWDEAAADEARPVTRGAPARADALEAADAEDA
ncbi:MAG: hypothetical protein KC486_21235 [Myxococcales bacterium]|nr:hypothetical protein [Myxococcales bacterium]